MLDGLERIAAAADDVAEIDKAVADLEARRELVMNLGQAVGIGMNRGDRPDALRAPKDREFRRVRHY